ncbi:hypothetical protein R1sor_025355 [Riccia sorocarpa]|uniref:Uncharacterized protein n=1 Tax=Riccia sorocarpa TaxID=122646 RepID=A0ABD3G8E0_9MARC
MDIIASSLCEVLSYLSTNSLAFGNQKVFTKNMLCILSRPLSRNLSLIYALMTEKEVMDEEENAEELEAGRGRHIIRNDVDVLNDNESRRFALLEVNKALKLWRGDVVLLGVSFVTGHRSVDCELDRNGIELLYKNICNSFNATAKNLPKSNSWKEYMTDVFDSYVNPDNDPDVRPLVAGLDAEDFSAEKIPGAAVALTPDDDGPDYETSLSERQRLKIQSDLLATAAEPQRMTRSTRTRLEYEPVLLSMSPPTKHDIVGGTSDTPTPSPPSSIPIDLTNDGLDGSSSPPPSQIVPTNAFVDLTQYISSPENNGSKDQGWPSRDDLTKEDLQSGMLSGKHLRGDPYLETVEVEHVLTHSRVNAGKKAQWMNTQGTILFPTVQSFSKWCKDWIVGGALLELIQVQRQDAGPFPRDGKIQVLEISYSARMISYLITLHLGLQ